MDKKILFLIPILALVLAGCTPQGVVNQIKSSLPLPKPSVSGGLEETIPSPTDQLEGVQGQIQEITLTVDSPTQGQVVTSPSLTVSGTIVPSAEVTVNEFELKADKSGKFSTTITLEEGENTIVVTANDETGASAEVDRTVTYQVPEK